MYLDYTIKAEGHICAMWEAYLLRAFANNMKYMLISVPGHIFGYSDFI